MEPTPTKAMSMPTETAAAAFGIKSGLFAVSAGILIAFLAVLTGFAIVPLTPGREMLDAVRRFAAGLFCSFTLGPLLAFKTLTWWPELLSPWQTILAGEHILWVYLAAATPFIALSAILGFWLVAALMAFFTKREGKDIGEIAADVRKDFSPKV